MLNNRDWASIIWLMVLAAFVLRHPSIRSSIGAVLRALAAPAVALSIAALVLYSLALVILGHRLGIWGTELIKDTFVWFVATALVCSSMFLGPRDVVSSERRPSTR